MRTASHRSIAPFLLALCFILTESLHAQQKNDRLPERFAIVFTFGYGEDDMLPADPTLFEIVVKRVKEAGFNTIMGAYADWKIEICKKHDMQFIVNLLTAEHHVYKNNGEGAKALCAKLKGNKAIWGYHLYSDMNYKSARGRSRDIDNVHQWDPTHPTFVGSTKLSGNNKLANPDVHGYYDFHWQRGPHMNFPHLVSAMAISKAKNAYFYRWMRVTSGLAGKGNPNRCLYTANTSMAFGLKGVFWFIGQEMMDTKMYEWNPFGKDIAAVNKQIAPLGAELMKLGQPINVYSTPTTRTLKDRDKGKDDPPIPSPLRGLPDNHWLQVKSGEAIVSYYKDGAKRDVLFIANHNTYAPQQMALQAANRKGKVEQFDAAAHQWKAATIEGGLIKFDLEPAAAAMVRFGP